MREHGRGLPGRAAQRALVARVANGLYEPVVEPVLRLVQPGRRIQQTLARVAGMAGKMGLAEEPGVCLGLEVLRGKCFARFERIGPGLLELRLRAIPGQEPVAEPSREELAIGRSEEHTSELQSLRH